MLPSPVFGQVEGEVATAVAGEPGRDGDQLAAQRGAAGAGVGRRGQGAGGAQQVVGEGGHGEPGGVGGEVT